MKSAKIRSEFLNYFSGKKHTIVPSSSLVPANDKTLLFTNAGMVQFKDVFTGIEKRPYKRAVTSQRCVRAGGKHNDLENVGYTARHHTFFEMLGNFSFGDYFKKKAILMTWEFLTDRLKLAPERLWITVHNSDEEAESIWLNDIGVKPERVSRLGDEDNFWSMGETGPCGPCSEVFFDHGSGIPGGPPGSEDSDLDRYIEIWNLVFMQYEQARDGSRTMLPRPSVDTGMGLERIAAVLQGVHSNYEIDLFQVLLAAAGEVIGTDQDSQSLRVIADHIRSCSFLICDGIRPSNEGRGYVLRRIIRRAIRHGHKLGCKEVFFHKIVLSLVNEMGDAYPELLDSQEFIKEIILEEENQFARTIQSGLGLLYEAIEKLDGKLLPGKVIFKLYDTHGFPLDLTNDIARERGLDLDISGFEKAMDGQRKKSKAASLFLQDSGVQIELDAVTEFTGYQKLTDQGSVTALIFENKRINKVMSGQEVSVILDKTSFYGESGGQQGDSGYLVGEHGSLIVKTTKPHGDCYVHSCLVKTGTVSVGDTLSTLVDKEKRQMTASNHSATHLLHAALRLTLGKHVSQKGSLVTHDKLRFDFSHGSPLTFAQLTKISIDVNNVIRDNVPIETKIMPLEQARKTGAMALFGEKYSEEVRVLKIGDFSTELCGGTHIYQTGDIGFFQILQEGGIASGVRRVEALTGAAAVNHVLAREKIVIDACRILRSSDEELVEKITQSQSKVRQLEKKLESIKLDSEGRRGNDILESAKTVQGVKCLSAYIPDYDQKMLRSLLDKLKNQIGTGVVALGSIRNKKAILVAGITSDLLNKIHAGDLISFMANQVGGKGGGRPDMAQAGGTDIDELPKTMDSVYQWVNTKLE